MANEDMSSKLIRLKSIIESKQIESGGCSEISEIIDIKVPNEVCNVLYNSEEINSLDIGFMGLSASSYHDLLEQYKNKKKQSGFFKQWGVDENFDVLGYKDNGYTFYMQYNLEGELDNSIDIENVKLLMPVFEFDGNFILYNLDNESSLHGLWYVSREGFGAVIAPDFSSHVDDLLDGLNSGRYFVKYNDIIYPTYWHDRLKLKAGLIKMDEYGEVID